jgi:hypothetical protein
LVFQIVDFSSISDLKFTYVHLQFQKFFSAGITPDPHDKWEGRERREGKERRQGKEGKEGRGGEQRKGWGEPPRKHILATALYETYNAVLVLHSHVFWFHQTDQKIRQQTVDRQKF